MVMAGMPFAWTCTTATRVGGSGAMTCAADAVPAAHPRYTYSFTFFFSSRRRHTRFDCDWSSDVCSSDLAITETVQAHLRHDQRPVAGEVVQAGEIGIEALVRFEIDVEAGKIQERKLQI